MFKKKIFRVSGSKKTSYAVLENGSILYDLLTKDFAKAIADICNAGIGPEWEKVEAELIKRGVMPPSTGEDQFKTMYPVGDGLQEKESFMRAPINDGSLWSRNEVQFPRLLAEVHAVLDRDQVKEIAKSMDLSVADVCSLFKRAETTFEALKKLHTTDKRNKRYFFQQDQAAR